MDLVTKEEHLAQNRDYRVYQWYGLRELGKQDFVSVMRGEIPK